ncbi:MAG: glycoside hydrolase family 3 protein [Spirochaetaceae bacterium]|nr:MAG: glycoside hydrolase family 3 protein [Spirochaetaceae bacterium]
MRRFLPILLAALFVQAFPASGLQGPERFTTPLDEATPSVSGGLFWSLPAERLKGVRWPDSNEVIDRHVDTLIASMSDEQRVAQVLMLAWNGQEPSQEIMRWIRERNLGGVKIFGWNAENLNVLARSLGTMQQASIDTASGIPLFTATDQEGGWVRHIKDGTLITPGNMAIGASGLPYDALMSARYIGLELRALGVNMNFAPTVDVYTNPEAHVIGPRAFSSDPHQTGILGLAFYRGLEQTGVIATAKHFPGHGNATGDSHGVLPVLDEDFETLWQRELFPFRMLVREGVPAVLGGHLSFPEITGVATPASLSPYFNITLLRGILGFQGVVVTDDLYMGGALVYAERNNWSFAELVKQAILAGNDSVMLSRTPAFDGEIWRTLINAYREEPEFRARVDESVRRILRVKIAYLIPEWRVPLFPETGSIREFVRIPEARTFFLDQAGRSVTMIRDRNLPHRAAPGERVLLAGRDPLFFSVGRRYYPGAGELFFSGTNFYSSLASDRARFVEMASRYDTIIFLLSDPNTLEILQMLRDSDKRIIVYSILTPVYLGALPWIEDAIAVYGWGTESFEAGFSVLQGDYQPTGILPLSLTHP